jgi:LacI family transcriptional regulator
MTTIVDVARAAGVSTATVSRVLNNHPQVDPRLAATVLQAVKVLGYRPSRVARSLRHPAGELGDNAAAQPATCPHGSR